MMASLSTLTAALLLAAQPPTAIQTPRQPNPFAPSLPQLTEEEENQLDQTINRFIDYESGKLRGPDTKKILTDFQKLGPPAIPALIRGLNRAAKIEHSCPAVVIAKKLARMLSTTHDSELLEFARENIGAGVTQSRHMGVIKDLRMVCILRKRSLAQEESRGIVRTLPGSKAISSARSTVGKSEVHELSVTELKTKLKDGRAEVRAQAAQAAGAKGIHLESELIDLLADDAPTVRKQAHQALVTLSKGADLGPKDGATKAEQKEAQRKWRDWLAKQGGH
jgi:hypothetical protein